MQENTDSFEDDFDEVSKTQRKREMHSLQTLGKALVQQSEERLRSLDLPEPLFDAIVAIKGFKAHGAIRRQLQYIGRLMRDVDPEPIQIALEKWSGHSRQEVAKQHLAERWREQLIADDDQLTRWIGEFPDTDIQAMRALIRQTRKEAGENKPPRAFRELYRVIFQALDNAS